MRFDHCKPAVAPADCLADLTKKQCPVSKDEKKEMTDVPYKQVVESLWYAANVTSIFFVTYLSHVGTFSHGISYTICYTVNMTACYADSD